MVGIYRSDAIVPLYALESSNFGNAKISSSAVETKNIDLQIPGPFYPKTLSMVFNATNNSDFVEVFLLDPNLTVIKKLINTHYLATTTDTINFADTRDAIPEFIYPAQYYLRIVFHNASGTIYTIVTAWDLWYPVT